MYSRLTYLCLTTQAVALHSLEKNKFRQLPYARQMQQKQLNASAMVRSLYSLFPPWVSLKSPINILNVSGLLLYSMLHFSKFFLFYSAQFNITYEKNVSFAHFFLLFL